MSPCLIGLEESSLPLKANWSAGRSKLRSSSTTLLQLPSNAPYNSPSADVPAPTYECSSNTPLVDEIRAIIQRLKHNKSPGEDALPPEIFQQCSDILAHGSIVPTISPYSVTATRPCKNRSTGSIASQMRSDCGSRLRKPRRYPHR